MKKITALLSILAVTSFFTVPVSAGTPASGSTNLSYSVTANYTITIPTDITITDEAKTGTYSVNANSLIEAGKKLQFAVTAATNYDDINNAFRLKNGSGTDVYLGYTITGPGSSSVVLNTVFLEATPAEVYAGKSSVLTYNLDTPESAGTYTDTLTITVSTVDA